jgi:glycopeptide antibiotics resistance protein
MSNEASPRTAECDQRLVREPSLRPASPANTRATEGEAGQDAACDTTIRMAYAAAAAGFVAYAVWGTLFPFDFHAVPLETAALLFWSRRAIDAGSLSLTDLVSNVLLFLPIGLFMSAALDRTWPMASRKRGRTPFRGLSLAKRGTAPFSIAVTLAAAIALSGTIEFLQAFVSWRTPSILDVAAEVLGAACGVAIWRYVRTELDALLRAALSTIGRSTPLERILLAGCAAFAIAWWLPADLTLRPDEIADKYFHKRLLLPFSPSPDAATASELAMIAVAAVPLGLAAVLCGSGSDSRRSVASGALIAALALVALELIQIPIFSRTTDGTELLAALGGSTAGSAAAALADRARIVGVDWRLLRIAAAVALSVGIAFVVEAWPFQVLDAPQAFLEAMRWSRAPFRWPASVSDVLPGAVLAAIAGAYARPRLDPRFVRLQTMLVVGLTGAVFVISEGGRLLLVGGRPTLMSVVIKLSALVCGLYIGSMMMSDRLHRCEEF